MLRGKAGLQRCVLSLFLKLDKLGAVLTSFSDNWKYMMLGLLNKIRHFEAGVRAFSTSSPLCEIRKLTRLRVVDNSRLGHVANTSGKPAKCIHVYNKTGVGTLGDKVLVAIGGQKKRAYIVGVVKKQKPFVPKFDTNNIVLIEDAGMPTGTRIRVPIPSMLRKKKDARAEFTKILSIATKFV